ncbi:hypothetical protein [Clostridium sporogenes]|nr:hypothetical protein [Clostridium sporogenes]EHN15631.1 hypothetical protein IYC_07760 [Clostridium sporogenes PA 3679]MDU4598427.1 hypothetical protein [Clostridium sporogenes]
MQDLNLQSLEKINTGDVTWRDVAVAGGGGLAGGALYDALTKKH